MTLKQLAEAMNIIGQVVLEEEDVLFNYSGATLRAAYDMLADLLSRLDKTQCSPEAVGAYLTLLMRMQENCQEVFDRYRTSLTMTDKRLDRKDLYDLGPSAVLCLISLALVIILEGCIDAMRVSRNHAVLLRAGKEMAALMDDLERAERLLQDAVLTSEKEQRQREKAVCTLGRQKEILGRLALTMANHDEMNV